jgi:hypothetical protein
MKRTTLAYLAVTLAVLVGTAARANDEQIATQIVQRLQQQQQTSRLEGFNIGVQVEQGTVTVMGTVSQTEHALLALDVARRVPGVKLVVNDLFVQPATMAGAGGGVAPASANAPLTDKSPSITAPSGTPIPGLDLAQATVSTQGPLPDAASTAIGTGATMIPQAPVQPPVLTQAPAVAGAPAPAQAQAQAQEGAVGSEAQPLAAARPSASAAGQKPVAFAQATRFVAQRAGMQAAPEYQQATDPAQYSYPASPAGPMPVSMGVAGGGAVAQASYDNPQMPGYAWPSYAAYPNYAALTYPHQYSPTAWPYIGPFYPYPQVPLGWRKVTLEWDDGWWFLDFKSKTKH